MTFVAIGALRVNVIMVNVLIFQQLFFFFSLIKFWFSGLEFTKCFSRIANREEDLKIF